MTRLTPLDLSPKGQETFGRVVFRVMNDDPRLSFEGAYAVVLDAWDLDCPACLGSGSKCLVCGSVVVRL